MPEEMKVQVRQVSPSASEAAISHHRVLIDRPVAKGGADAGPMGGELFLASVGGCFMSTLLAAIRGRGKEISSVRVEVAGSSSARPPDCRTGAPGRCRDVTTRTCSSG